MEKYDVKITQEALDKAITIDKISIDTIIKLLPSFIHLPPDEAAKAAINYAKALIKELER